MMQCPASAPNSKLLHLCPLDIAIKSKVIDAQLYGKHGLRSKNRYLLSRINLKILSPQPLRLQLSGTTWKVLCTVIECPLKIADACVSSRTTSSTCTSSLQKGARLHLQGSYKTLLCSQVRRVNCAMKIGRRWKKSTPFASDKREVGTKTSKMDFWSNHGGIQS